MPHAGIVLCGGQSRRMGTAKWALPFGPETMLERVVRLLGLTCRPVVVVAASDQQLPELGAGVVVARDLEPGRGPLAGLLAGLSALPAGTSAAYATGCDVPLLAPAFVHRMFALLEDHAAAVPESGGFLHPLSAVYRTSLIDVMRELLDSGRARPTLLFDIVHTRRVSEAELVDVDPHLLSLRNVNTPDDYRQALVEAGFAE